MGPAVESSGGSAANTIVGVASFGARAAFVGKVKDDPLGNVFAHDIRAAGVAFDTPPAFDGPSTARCYVLVTPDGERTMNTYLGAAQDLHPQRHRCRRRSAAAAITYLEGYLWDPKHAKDAFLKAAEAAHDADRHGRADPVGRVLRRSLARRVSRSRPQAARSISCSPTRRNCTASIRPPISTPRSRRCARRPGSPS